MASLPRTWAAIVASVVLVAAPAAAENPEPAAPAATAAAPPPPPPATPPPPPGPPPASFQSPSVRRGPPGRSWARPRRVVVPPKPKGDVLPAEGTPIASSPTFARLEDGKSRIFVEVNRKVPVVETRTPGRLIYRLQGAVVVQRTNQLALPTGFFTTPVNRVQLVQQGPDLDLVIELREATDVTYHVVDTPRGMALWVDFPRSLAFGQDDSASDPARPRARRGTTTQHIGDTPPSDDTSSLDHN